LVNPQYILKTSIRSCLFLLSSCWLASSACQRTERQDLVVKDRLADARHDSRIHAFGSHKI